MQQDRRARGGGGRCVWIVALAALSMIVLGTAPTSADVPVGPITIPLPLTLPGLSSPPPGQRAAPVKTTTRRRGRAASADPFASRGMWIWQLGASSGGSLPSIIAKAHRYGIGTLYLKSSDGIDMWSQFNYATVAALKRAGLRVCAWQYVYGDYPRYEAQAGANAVHDGANCLVIDAEGQYEGKYYQAQVYITRLRRLIGASFPLALAGLPYIDYHPAFPYSVFLGPGGAQYNLPQMYWRDIGTSVKEVYAHTYLYNRIYLRPVYPLGQVFGAPPNWQIERFRQFSSVYGALGVSWWDWQEAPPRAWRAISQWVAPLANATAVPGEATIAKGAAGDLVVWAQEHLRAAGEAVAIDGGFGRQTLRAVEDFQSAHGLPADGVIGPQTWTALLRYQPAAVRWVPPAKPKAAARIAGASRITAAQVAAGDTYATSGTVAQPPASALLPDRGHELPSPLGAGAPR